MSGQVDFEWRWFRCSIIGCGAGPLRVRRHPHHPSCWSVGFTESQLWVVPGPKPVCPICGDYLDALAAA
jgi:hypothetical protein